jgi:hypothetical protein
MDLIKIVKTIEPEYKNTDQCINPLPNEVELTLDNEDYLIEVNLKDDVLKTNFWQGVEQYKASDDDIDYIYNYLEQLLLSEIEQTKEYYNENNYNYQVWN